jgi:Holliday junction resolvase
MSRGAQVRGIQRERDLANQLREEGWFVLRAAGSHGEADLIALHVGRDPRMIEVKSTKRGPFAGFSPADRAHLLESARQAGAQPWLVWWPPREKPQWIPPNEWPGAKS